MEDNSGKIRSSVKVTKAELKKMQLHPITGKPFTPQQFYMQKQGGVLAVAKFQSALGELVTEAIIMNVVTDEVWELLKAHDVKSALEEKLENKESNISYLFRDNFKKYKNTFLERLEELKAKVDNCEKIIDGFRYNKTINPDVAKKYRRKEIIKKKEIISNFVGDRIYKHGFVKSPEELLDPNEVDRYEKAYKKFVEGFVAEERGERKWQLGWDEAQANIRNMVLRLPEDIAAAYVNLWNDPVQKAIDAAKPEDVDKVLKSFHRKSGGRKKLEDYKEKKKDLEKMPAKLSAYKDLLEETENYRNNNEPMNIMLWEYYKKDFPKIVKQGVTYDAIPPKQDIEYSPDDPNYKGRPPYAELCNKLAKLVGFNIVDNGVKSYESLIRKIDNPRFHNDPTGIFDSARDTVGVERSQGVNYLISNILRVAKHKNMKVCATEKADVYDNFMVSYKINVAITIEMNGKEYTRVGEIKIIDDKQLKVKPICDKIYNARRLLVDDMGDENFELKNLEKASPDYFQKIYNTVGLILEDSNVKNAISKFGMKFSAVTRDFNYFDYHRAEKDNGKEVVHDNYKSLYEDLTMLERLINLEALSREEPKMKQIAYSSFMDNYNKKTAKANIMSDKKEAQDILNAIEGDKALFSRAFTGKELKAAEDRYKDKGSAEHKKG